MDLRQLIQIIKKYSLFIIILAVLGAVGGGFSARLTSSGFQRTQTYIISNQSQVLQNNPNYYSENFYAEENLRNNTDTYIAVLQSNDFQKEAVVSGDSLQVKKVAPQVLRLTYSSPIEQNSSQNLDKVVVFFNSLIGDLTKANLAIRLEPVGMAQEPVFSRVNSTTLLFAGAFIGIAFALFIVGLKEYNNL